MRELSLFSGAGGGLLGTKLLGWRHCGYVEYEAYCQKIIRQRIEDGILDNAPIFGDIRAFISEGYADGYKGMVDVITAGFPCQPFSQAGKRRGSDDSRNMWPATIEVVRRVRPRWCLFENVPGLISFDYFGTILADLEEAGYHIERPIILAAADVGAPHLRKRLWIMAYARSEKSCGISGFGREEVATVGYGCENVAHPASVGPHSEANLEIVEGEGRGELQPGQPGNNGSDWWSTEPDVGRVAHGVASRVDRLKAIGNGQVPAVVRAAWHLIGA